MKKAILLGLALILLQALIHWVAETAYEQGKQDYIEAEAQWLRDQLDSIRAKEVEWFTQHSEIKP